MFVYMYMRTYMYIWVYAHIYVYMIIWGFLPILSIIGVRVREPAKRRSKEAFHGILWTKPRRLIEPEAG